LVCGLDFSFRRLKSLGAIALGGGCLQALITFVLFALVLSFLLPTSEAIVLGAIAALSSTAVVLRVLADRTEIDSTRGRNALGILLIQDMAVVPLILLISILGGGNSILEISVEIGKFIAAASVSRYVINQISDKALWIVP
jgi:CPA2 family monovalent cation:H+ antiporter-2